MKEDKFFIGGRKVVLDALLKGEGFQKIYIQHGSRGEEIDRIEKLARKSKIPLVQMDKRKFETLSPNRHHQGVLALTRFPNILTQERLLEEVAQRNRAFLLYADRFNDPHNLGALIRTAEIFAVDAVAYTLKDGAPISPGVVKASMGAALKQKLVAVRTPFQFLQALQKNGFSLVGAQSGENSIPLWEYQFPEKCCLIIGNEESGIKHSLQPLIQVSIHIPQWGETESFNASVAGGIIIYEYIRQKTARNQTV